MSSELLSIHDSHTERDTVTLPLSDSSLTATISDTQCYGGEDGGQEGSRRKGEGGREREAEEAEREGGEGQGKERERGERKDGV